MNSTELNLAERLKAETQPIHRRIEKLAFFEALLSKSLPLQSFQSYLHVLGIVHAVLERALATSDHPHVKKIWDSNLAKLQWLLKDQEGVDGKTKMDIRPATERALQLADQIIVRQLDTPHFGPLFLVGALYVLEGSQNGGAYLRSAILNCFGWPVDKLKYFGCSGEQTTEVWKRFKDKLNLLTPVLSEEESAMVVAGAVATFEGLEKVLTALYPYKNEDLKMDVTAMNPEAGRHAMPQLPEEVGVALRAGRAAWSRFSYLEARYADRGLRFTTSDSCWLATLYRIDSGSIKRNLTWLRGVLAPRGITSILLEFHLEALLAEFESTFPERKEDFLNFRAAIRDLKMERTTILGEGRWNGFIQEFDSRFHACAGLRVSHPTELVMSAWWDERSGLKGSFEAICKWLADTQRFSNEWISLVEQLVAKLESY